MDNLDTFDSSEIGGSPENIKEAPSERAEKNREKSARALAGIQRSQKDESKSKKQS